MDLEMVKVLARHELKKQGRTVKKNNKMIYCIYYDKKGKKQKGQVDLATGIIYIDGLAKHWGRGIA